MRAAEGASHDALLCSDGCGRRWVSDFGRRLCGFCSEVRQPGTRAPARQAPLPLSPAAKHWQDAKERDDEPLPF